MADHIVELTDETFSSSIASGVAVVEFYGAWCPPCKMLEPVVADIARDFAEKAFVGKLNVDDHGEAAVEQSIADIPTLIFYQNGAEQARLFGAQHYDVLAEKLNSLLNG